MRQIAWLTGLLFVIMASAARAITWDFETGTSGWRPRDQTVDVKRAFGPGPHHMSLACLRVKGAIRDGWNYALSERAPLREGQWYRLSAWVRVDLTGPRTPMPYLKCEFVAAGGRGSLGRATTDEYNNAKMGRWQRLSCDFETPAGTTEGVVALEKGTSGTTEIDAYLDDVTLDPMDADMGYQPFRLHESAKALEKRRGVHPRLYLTGERLVKLRQAIRTTHADLWSEVEDAADRAVRQGPPAYRTDDTAGGDEQLWQRPVGNTLPYLAIAYLLSGQQHYLEATKQWALASCSYPTWGYGQIDGMDLAAGHQLFGLALVYDWCYHDLDKRTLERIRETLTRRCAAMFRAAAKGQLWWHRSYLQNHLWVNICGLGTAGLALFDEVDEANLWIGLPVRKFEATMDALGSDGASHEGVGYWQYGAEYMLKFMSLADELLDIDLYDRPWWKRTAGYGLYLSLPRNAWTVRNCIVDLADCPRYHWYGPDHILRHLAAKYEDGHAQWLARQIDEADVAAASAGWLNLIWYDPSVQPAGPQDLPTLHRFDDMGIVSARSDWSGDEALVVFKCGPFIGHEAIDEFSYDPGGGHVHPDAGHVVLFAQGQWLLRDDGYQAKWTHQHNTLLVDGQGQLGEGNTFFAAAACLSARARPRLRGVVAKPRYDHIAADVTQAYPKDLGLKHFRRHLLFIKPDVLLVLDDVLCDQARDLELRFHPESDQRKRQGHRYLIDGADVTLRLELLTPKDVDMDAADFPLERRDGEQAELFTVRFLTHRKHWRNATALSWGPTDRQAKTVKLHEDGDFWRFTIDKKELIFDWQSGKVMIEP